MFLYTSFVFILLYCIYELRITKTKKLQMDKQTIKMNCSIN